MGNYRPTKEIIPSHANHLGAYRGFFFLKINASKGGSDSAGAKKKKRKTDDDDKKKEKKALSSGKPIKKRVRSPNSGAARPSLFRYTITSLVIRRGNRFAVVLPGELFKRRWTSESMTVPRTRFYYFSYSFKWQLLLSTVLITYHFSPPPWSFPFSCAFRLLTREPAYEKQTNKTIIETLKVSVC